MKDLVDQYLESLPEREKREGIFDTKNKNVPATPIERNLWLICATLQASIFAHEEGLYDEALSRLSVCEQALAERRQLIFTDLGNASAPL